MKKNVIITMILLLITTTMTGSHLISCTGKKPPDPKITYMEFPFMLSYKLNGEIITIEDSYVCEYQGVKYNKGYGYHRTWTGYIKSSNDDLLLITEDNERKIYCLVGDPQYYMNEDLYELTDFTTSPHLIAREKDGTTPTRPKLSTEEICDYYNIELLDWDFSPPLTTDN